MGVKNKSNPVDWQRAFMKKYADGYMPTAVMADSQQDSSSIRPKMQKMVKSSTDLATFRGVSRGSIAILASSALVLTVAAFVFVASRSSRQDSGALESAPYLLVED